MTRRTWTPAGDLIAQIESVFEQWHLTSSDATEFYRMLHAALKGRAIPRAYISHRACMPPVLDYAATPGALSVTTLYELPDRAQEGEPSDLRKAAEFAVKALDEEAAAYYPDAIAHVDEARNRLRAALAQAQKERT